MSFLIGPMGASRAAGGGYAGTVVVIVFWVFGVFGLWELATKSIYPLVI